MSPLVIRARRVEGPPVVSVRVWIRGGSRLEAIPGQALLSGRLLGEGSRRRDWRRIHEEAENRGLSIGTSAGHEAQSVTLDGLAEDWELALAWAAELSLEPAFPPERCSWLIEQAKTELDSIADHPEALAEWEFRRQLYSPHAKGRPLQGSREGLAALDAEACRVFHERALRRGLIVSVAGSIEPERVERRARELFAAAAERAAESDPSGAESSPSLDGLEARRSVRLPKSAQGHLYRGRLTVPRASEDLVPLELLGVVLGSGSGLNGRLPHRVREVEGLAYSCHVAAAAGAGLDPGFAEIYVGTSGEGVARAETAVSEELDRLLEDGIAPGEIEEARSFLLGREPFRRETARQWSAILGEAELFALPIDEPEWLRRRLGEVELTDVETVARRFFDPSSLKTTIARPGEIQRRPEGASGASIVP